MLPTNIGESGQPRTARTQVVGLSEHRTRRRRRLRIARALQSGDAVRSVLLEHLEELSRITGGDRAAAVWIDEYGATRIHPHLTLDLLSDHPRRSFAAEPFERAWELGLPGAYEGVSETLRGQGDGPNLFTVALGSDGARAWFVVSDSVRTRSKLTEEERQRALFLAGECAAVLLHRDLDEAPRANGAAQSGAGRGFAGWAVLEDLQGREDRPEDATRIEQRFVLVRLVRDLLEHDLVFPPDGWRARVRSTRAEIARRADEGGDPEELWAPALDALEHERLPDVAEALVELGAHAEALGHRHGALELHRCAFRIAADTASLEAAVDAARFQGRIQRRFARWDESIRAYRLAHEIAVAGELWSHAAQVLTGLASVRRETGNLPGARQVYLKALNLAERSGEPDTVALVHHGMLSVEHVAGNLEVALQHGWKAVASYQDERGRLRCLASLAGALSDFGDRKASEDAWTIVAQRSDESYYRIYAHDALAHLAALRSDLPEFERQAAACDALGWESGPLSAKAEILFYRGKSYRALGLYDAAERWLSRAVEFAQENGFNRTLFEAEDALEALKRERDETAATASEETMPAAPPEVREGLREMRRALATATA